MLLVRRVCLVFWLVSVVVCVAKDEYYRKAVALIEDLDEESYEMLDSKLANMYETVDDISVEIPPMYYVLSEARDRAALASLGSEKKRIVEYLTRAAEQGHGTSAFMLGDLYLYGNHSVPRDAGKALRYYKLAAILQGDGASHYMVGFLYATGLFGKLAVDQAKANLYFRAAADMQHVPAMMVLGYRYLHGISVAKDCRMALFYYSAAARLLYAQHVQPSERYGTVHLESYAVRIRDFDKFDLLNAANRKPVGIPLVDYGNNLNNAHGAFELPSSVDRRVSNFIDETLLNDFKLDEHEHFFAEQYYKAVVAYEGDYIRKRNYTKAFKTALFCAQMGTELEVDNRSLALYFANQCSALVSHCYLRGEGVEQNIEEAKKWLSKPKKVMPSARQYEDLALINHLNLSTDNIDRLLTRASSNSALYQYARIHKDALTSDGDIMKKLTRAAHGNVPEALYLMGTLGEAQAVTAATDCSANVHFYKSFVEKLEPHVSSLAWAFQRLMYKDYDNALIGYAMAAEQGYETAQSSAASLLYQIPTKLGKFPNVSADRIQAAINYLTKSSQQQNIDSTVLLGDLYYHNLVANSANQTESRRKNYEKASACYNAASVSQSSQASWNLGYMFEHGIGVNRDFHLAKRMYDLALVGHPKSFLPVQLSLLKLAAKIKLYRLCGWPLFEGNNVHTDKELQPPKRTWSAWWNVLFTMQRTTLQDLDQAAAAMAPNRDIRLRNYNEDTDFTKTELIVLAFFVVIFLAVYGTRLYIQWKRRRDWARRRENGENVPGQPPPPPAFDPQNVFF